MAPRHQRLGEFADASAILTDALVAADFQPAHIRELASWIPLLKPGTGIRIKIDTDGSIIIHFDDGSKPDYRKFVVGS